MSGWRKLLRRVLGVVLGIVLMLGAMLWATRARVQDLPPLRDGDIVFQTSHAVQSAAIAIASHSVYSHMGLIEMGADGQPNVVEASTTVRSVPLQSWINRGVGGRITIKRVKDLTPEAAKSVLAAAHQYDGLPYDMYFTFGRDAFYCSEHVRLAYEDGAHIEIGALQPLRSLAVGGFVVSRLIRQRWTKHPACQPPENFTFETCYAKLLEQNLVTPVSIARDAKLETIYSNFGSFGD